MSSLFKSPKIAAHTVHGALTEAEIQVLIQTARTQLKAACSDLQRTGNRAQMTSFFGRKADKACYKIATGMYAELNNDKKAVSQVIESIYQLYNDYVTDFNNPVPSVVFSALVNKIPGMLNNLAEEENTAAMHNTLHAGG